MATVIRAAKRVSDPLDHKMKARLIGDKCSYSSIGREHGAVEPSCFSGLVHAFLEIDDFVSVAAVDDGDGDNAADHCNGDFDSDGGNGGDDLEDMAAVLRSKIEALGKRNRFCRRLLSDVTSITEDLDLAELKPRCSGYRRVVVKRLREAGYNAGLCKASWESQKGLVAGRHEYIDVVAAGKGEGTTTRYIVDVGFPEEFEIARATKEYTNVAAALPRVLLVTPEEVKQLVRAVAKAARKSLKSRGLHPPPWRKSRYMVAKWLGPYRRTTNPLSSSSVATAAGNIKCPTIGFHICGAANPSCS